MMSDKDILQFFIEDLNLAMSPWKSATTMYGQ